jgi:hypothetical protein
MEPVTTTAAILAATQLIGGLLGQKAAAKQAQQQNILQAGATQFGMEQQANQLAEQKQQGALGNLVEAYRSALLGG